MGIQEPGGTDDLFHHLVGGFHFVGPGSGRNVDDLPPLGLEFIKSQRPVVDGRRQPEPVLHQLFLPRPVSGVHGSELGQGHMALVDHRKEIFGEVVHQGKRRFPGLPSCEMPGIVLDAAAITQFLHHLQIIIGPLFQPLGLQELIFPL